MSLEARTEIQQVIDALCVPVRVRSRYTIAISVCAVCKKYLGREEWAWNGERSCVTHTYCDACVDRLYPVGEC